MNQRNLSKLLRETLKLSHRAGAKLLKLQQKISTLHISHKVSQGVVSTADKQIEQFLINHLNTLYPKIPVLAEESAYKEFQQASSRSNLLRYFENAEYSWIIDPLDGTTNFLNGMDYFCICISLLHYGRPILGIVHRPTTNTSFYSLRGQGGFKKTAGKRSTNIFIKNNIKKLSNTLLATGFSSEKSTLSHREFEILKKIILKCRGIRRMGSAALDLCYVAEGVFDCFWEKGLAPWDVAAAGLICEEAGVHVTDYNRNVFHPFQNSIMACRNPLYNKVARQIL